MRFDYTVDGVQYKVVIDYYSGACPMRITGTGFGDAEPPEPETIEFHLENNDGTYAHHLDDLITDEFETKVFEEFKRVRESRGKVYPCKS